MSIRDNWPGGEGPRDKLHLRGPAALTDAELLALFLGTGRRGQSVMVLAQELLMQFGGLGRLLGATERELLAIPGLGQAKSALLRGVLEMARRSALGGLTRSQVLTSPDKTRRFLQYHLHGQRREVFSCVFVNSQHAVICCEDLFWGTLDGAAVYPREVVVRALYHNAAAVIFAHNHPSGVTEPSQADRRITQRLQKALALMDIRVLDHIIVGEGQPFSFAEEGLL